MASKTAYILMFILLVCLQISSTSQVIVNSYVAPVLESLELGTCLGYFNILYFLYYDVTNLSTMTSLTHLL